ncbi:hypothetical protein Tco_0265993 [Tanacetum coccineum]
MLQPPAIPDNRRKGNLDILVSQLQVRSILFIAEAKAFMDSALFTYLIAPEVFSVTAMQMKASRYRSLPILLESTGNWSQHLLGYALTRARTLGLQSSLFTSVASANSISSDVGYSYWHRDERLRSSSHDIAHVLSSRWYGWLQRNARLRLVCVTNGIHIHYLERDAQLGTSEMSLDRQCIVHNYNTHPPQPVLSHADLSHACHDVGVVALIEMRETVVMLFHMNNTCRSMTFRDCYKLSASSSLNRFVYSPVNDAFILMDPIATDLRSTRKQVAFMSNVPKFEIGETG